ncbi:MAG: CBS domain-containing protein [Christensenellales bacterium]
MKLLDIMSKDIAFLNPDDSVEQAAWLMKRHNIGSVPICSDNQVIGIVTDRDIALRSVADGAGLAQTVGDIMTTNPVLGDPQMDVCDAARIMSDNQIRRLPVVDNGQLVGMVALGDISVDPSFSSDAEQALSNISQPCDHT